MNQYIEHTLLSPTLTGKAVDRLVAEAKDHEFAGVCVPPFWVKRAQRELGNSPVQLVTVIGFPLGYQMTETKMEEMRLALRDGARELDWVLNMSSFKEGMPWTKIELAKASKAAHEQEALLKVIIETAYLTDEEIVKACKLCVDAGADFVKTSTGFAPKGAEAEKVALMRQCCPAHVGIKASGGIRSLAQAQAMVNAGAERLGTSAGLAIMEELAAAKP